MPNLAQTKDELDVVDEEVSCFTYTPDLAQATAELIISKAPTGIYHIVNPGALTWYQAAFDLFKLKKLSINIKALSSEALARPARRPKYSILKNTKLKPLRNYREALKEYLQ
ncbi:MAG: sugar nucleotide-binding protein [Candidatus Falkowbacteria bacterium]|nr:sugar nucleotide-binding protein [Candidatus Falkowbacteria bacterium]